MDGLHPILWDTTGEDYYENLYLHGDLLQVVTPESQLSTSSFRLFATEAASDAATTIATIPQCNNNPQPEALKQVHP